MLSNSASKLESLDRNQLSNTALEEENNENNLDIDGSIDSIQRLSKQSGYELELTDKKYLMATFTSSLKNHSIKVEIDIGRKEILINTMHIQYKSPVELAVMLKKMVIEMKKLTIAYVIQQVTKSDWINILRAQHIFVLMNENVHGFLTVKCDIDRFPESVMCALGFNSIYTKRYMSNDQSESNDEQMSDAE